MLWDLQFSKKVDLRAGGIMFAVPCQLKSVRAVFEMDDLARYMLLGVFDLPLRFVSSLMSMTSILFAQKWISSMRRWSLGSSSTKMNQDGDPFLCRSLSSLGVLDDGSVSGF